MESTVIERPDESEETNVEEASPETTETVETADTDEVVEEDGQESPEETDGEATETSQDEPTVELDGEKIPLSQIRKMRQDYANDSKWTEKNTKRAQELSEKEKRLAKFELLESQLEQRPEVLQELFKPKPQRDFNAEVQAINNARPDPNVDWNGYVNWENARTRLIAEQVAHEQVQQVQAAQSQELARQHNINLLTTSREKYKEKLSDEEFQQAAKFIEQTILPQNGKYPHNSFDIAYYTLFADRAIREAKTGVAKNIATSMSKAVPASGNRSGVSTTIPRQSQQDKDDDDFAALVKERYSGSTRKGK
jgi:hypothetical protein